MFLVMDLAPSDAAEPSRASSEISADGSPTSAWPNTSFLKGVYSKARSMTASTDASSVSTSTDLDPLESLDSMNDASLRGNSNVRSSSPSEDIEEQEAFYECRSQAGSQHSLATLIADVPKKQSPPVNHDNEIVRYVNGRCVYADGTPAFAPPGCRVSTVPYEYIEFHNEDVAKATKMWKATLAWRKENDIGTIHTRPNARFHHAKKYYPSTYHGVDKDNCVLEYSFPGQMVPHKLFPTAADIDAIMEHHVFMQEYSFNCLYMDAESWKQVGKTPITTPTVPDETTTRGVVMVIDVKDAGINFLSGNVFSFMKRMIVNGTSHYPAMVVRVIILNSPFWVAGVYRTIKPLLPDDLEVDIVSEKDTLNVLRSYCDDDQIPKDYGGSSPYPLYQHPFERRLLEAIEEAANYGKERTTVRRNDSQDDTTDTRSSTSSSSYSAEDGSAKELVLSVAAELNFDDQDRLNKICGCMLQEHVVNAWQLQHLESSEFRSLGFPLGLASAVRRKVAEAPPQQDEKDTPFARLAPLSRKREPTFVMDPEEADDGVPTLTPSPPCFNPFKLFTNGFKNCGGGR